MSLSFLIKIKLVYECAFVIPMVDKCHKVVKYLLCFRHFNYLFYKLSNEKPENNEELSIYVFYT